MNASIEEIPLSEAEIQTAVARQLAAVSFIDMHTHLYAPALKRLGLWGIDELLTYHYLEAEFFRYSPMTPEEYWSLGKRERADAIWRVLFTENTPVSEATRGVVAVLHALGLRTDSSNLTDFRDFFASQDLESHINLVLRVSGLSEVVMTNDPLNPEEGPLWERGIGADSRFHAVLRLDRILNRWAEHWKILEQRGYAVNAEGTGNSITEVRRFLAEWCARMKPVYMAVSLPDSFRFPEESIRSKLLASAVLPACREFDIPMSLMIGVRYQVNPQLRLAGDGVGSADLRSLERICLQFPDNRFLVSLLSRENQHELCVYTRKFNNLMPFGCWWFLNNPSIVEEITRERLEMLGTTFIPQHSDARILEQLVYKWRNTRRTLAPILASSYQLLVADGRNVTETAIRNDINRLFRSNFERWTRIVSLRQDT